MKVRYLGDHEEMSLYGIDFSGGVWVDVDLPPNQIRKLMNNSHFECVPNVEKCGIIAKGKEEVVKVRRPRKKRQEVK